MVQFEELVLPEVETNMAIQDIINYALGLMDTVGGVQGTTGVNNVITDAAFGWAAPEGPPREDQGPVVLRIWCDSGIDDMDNNDNLTSSGSRVLSLFFYFYAFGNITNIQAQRERFVRHFLHGLSDPATLAAFQTLEWEIDYKTRQDIQIDHTQALKRVLDYITVKEPWYVTRVDIPILVYYDFPT